MRSETPQQIADRLGLSERTIRRWCSIADDEGDVAAPHTRLDDGTIWLDFGELKEWMDATGRTGDPGRPLAAHGVDDAFWSWHGFSGPIELPRNEHGVYWSREHFNALPARIYTAFERDIIEGRRTLNSDEVRLYVRDCVNLKALIVDIVTYLPGWLVRQNSEEIGRRLRGALFEKLDWHECSQQSAADDQDGIERDDAGRIIGKCKPGDRARFERRVDRLAKQISKQINNERPKQKQPKRRPVPAGASE